MHVEIKFIGKAQHRNKQNNFGIEGRSLVASYGNNFPTTIGIILKLLAFYNALSLLSRSTVIKPIDIKDTTPCRLVSASIEHHTNPNCD